MSVDPIRETLLRTGLPSKCAAPNCLNSRRTETTLSFFGFPKDPERCAQWIVNSGRTDLDIVHVDKIAGKLSFCEEHFEPIAFMNPKEKGVCKRGKRLVPTAVPTLFSTLHPPPLAAIKRNLLPLKKNVKGRIEKHWEVKLRPLLVNRIEANAPNGRAGQATMVSTQRRGGNWCSAINCSNARIKQPDLSFFRFPSEKERCAKWVQNCRREDLRNRDSKALNSCYFLCSEHFELEMFMDPKKKNKLIWSAVPTIFDIKNPPSKIAPKRKLPSRNNSSPKKGMHTPKPNKEKQTIVEECSNSEEVCTAALPSSVYHHLWKTDPNAVPSDMDMQTLPQACHKKQNEQCIADQDNFQVTRATKSFKAGVVSFRIRTFTDAASKQNLTDKGADVTFALRRLKVRGGDYVRCAKRFRRDRSELMPTHTIHIEQ